LEQINSPSGYHRDGEILHVIKLVGLQARSGVLVQTELGAAALRKGRELRLRLGDASGASGAQCLAGTGVILLVCDRMDRPSRSASLTK